MWNMKTTVIPVITGATGTISKSFRKYVGYIAGSHEARELQKTAILGTAHIIREVLTQKTTRTNVGTRDIRTIHRTDNKTKEKLQQCVP